MNKELQDFHFWVNYLLHVINLIFSDVYHSTVNHLCSLKRLLVRYFFSLSKIQFICSYFLLSNQAVVAYSVTKSNNNEVLMKSKLV